MSDASRIEEIREWHGRAMKHRGVGLDAMDADALADDIGWLLERVDMLERVCTAVSVTLAETCKCSGPEGR